MKMEFSKPKNCLTINFVQTHSQSKPYFHKFDLLLKLSDPVKRPILYQTFHKEILLGFVLMSKIFETKSASS